LPAGALADRWDRRRMMLWADAGRALLTMVIPLSFWLGWPTLAVVLIVALPINTLRVLSDAGFSSAVPTLVGRENLGRANSYMEASLSVPFIIGPAIAGVLVATVGPATTIAIDAATFAVSAAALTFVRRSLRAERPAELPNVLADIRQGIVFVWRSFVLRSIIAYWAVLQISTAALIPALGYYITIDRRLGAELFGFVGSAWSVGYLVGSLLVGRLGRQRVGLRMVLAGALVGGAIVAISLTRYPPVYLAAAFLIGSGLAIVLVSYATLRASATPDALLGRVGSTARMITLGLMPVGLLAGGALIEMSDAGSALVAMGGVAILASLLFGLSPAFRETAEQA
jgi:MFS family permease